MLTEMFQNCDEEKCARQRRWNKLNGLDLPEIEGKHYIPWMGSIPFYTGKLMKKEAKRDEISN